jgi:hypothetical protein
VGTTEKVRSGGLLVENDDVAGGGFSFFGNSRDRGVGVDIGKDERSAEADDPEVVIEDWD